MTIDDAAIRRAIISLDDKQPTLSAAVWDLLSAYKEAITKLEILKEQRRPGLRDSRRIAHRDDGSIYVVPPRPAGAGPNWPGTDGSADCYHCITNGGRCPQHPERHCANCQTGHGAGPCPAAEPDLLQVCANCAGSNSCPKHGCANCRSTDPDHVCESPDRQP